MNRPAGGRSETTADRRMAAGMVLALGLLFLVLATYKPNQVEAADPRADTTRVMAQLEAAGRQINDLTARLEEDRQALEQRQHAIERLQAHGHPTWIADVAWDEAVAAGVPPETGLKLIGQESDWDIDLVHLNINRTLDYGPMQINQVMLDALGLDDPLDPIKNIRAGMHHLGYLIRKYGNLDRALTAYNRGEAGEASWEANRGTPRSPYSQAILGKE